MSSGTDPYTPPASTENATSDRVAFHSFVTLTVAIGGYGLLSLMLTGVVIVRGEFEIPPLLDGIYLIYLGVSSCTAVCFLAGKWMAKTFSRNLLTYLIPAAVWLPTTLYLWHVVWPVGLLWLWYDFSNILAIYILQVFVIGCVLASIPFQHLRPWFAGCPVVACLGIAIYAMLRTDG